jgi:integrase/recombinase XerD
MPTHRRDPLVRLFLRDVRWAAATRSVAGGCLDRWTTHLHAIDVKVTAAEREHVENYLADLGGRGRAAGTLALNLRFLRAFYQWASSPDVDEVDVDPTRRVPAPKVTESAAHVVTEEEYRALVGAVNKRTVHGRRDHAMLTILWGSGLRRGEVVALDLDDLEELGRGQVVVTVGNTARPTKTGKVRRVPLSGEAAAALDRYLIKRGDEPGPLFVSHRGGRLSPKTLSQMLDRHRVAAGITHRIGAHGFRRAMAIRYKRAGGSDPGLMAVAGWSTTQMVGRYTRAAAEELAHEEYWRLLDPPNDRPRRQLSRIRNIRPAETA